MPRVRGGLEPRREGIVRGGGDSLTEQQHADECDINVIVARWRSGIVATHVNKQEPVFADVSEMRSFQEASELVRNAEAFFMGLPAKTRAGFENDVELFVDHLATSGDWEKFEELGLLNAEETRKVQERRQEAAEAAEAAERERLMALVGAPGGAPAQ